MLTTFYAEDESPLDASIECPASQDYSKAYVHHLVRSNELLASMILSWHNIAYFQDLMARMRASIAAGTFETFVSDFRKGWMSGKTPVEKA